MWSRKDVAQALLAAILFLIVGLLLFPPVSRPALYKRVSPAYWIWKHTHPRHGEYVGVQCRNAGTGYTCLLVIQAAPKARFCWLVAVVPHRHAWRVIGVEPLSRRDCPKLRITAKTGPRALKQ